MTKLDDINRLAEIKSIIQTLDAEAKAIQKVLLEDPDCPTKIATEYGKLSLTVRTNYELTSKQDLIDRITLERFIEACTCTLPSVRKVCGTAVADVLVPDLFQVKSVSKYFSLRK